MLIVPALSPNFIKANNARLSGTVEHALRKAHKAAYEGWKPTWSEKEFILKPNADLVVSVLRSMAGKAVAYDVETDGRHSKENALRCIGFYDGKVGIIVPLLYRDGSRHDVVIPNKKGELEVENRAVWKKFFTGAAETKVLQAVRDLLGGGQAKVKRDPTSLAARILYTQNGQYDRQVIRAQTGISIKAGATGYTFDTIVAHHVMCPYLPHRLGILAALMTDAPYYKATESGEAWSAGTDRELWLYCLRDVKTTWLIAEMMYPEVANEYPQAAAVFEQDTWQEDQCELWKDVGVELDPAALRYYRHHYTTIRDRALAAMREVLLQQGIGSENPHFVSLLDKLAAKADVEVLDDDGSGKTVEAFNPGSLIELRMMLAGLGIPLSELTASGQLSTAKELLTAARKGLLESKATADDPRIAFLDYLFAWRESAKIVGTYLYPEVLCSGRVHPTFSVHVVPTGRLNSSGPNFQNQPAEIRGMFVARKGHVLISMDWDALEMRLGAFLSKDPAYIKVFLAYDAKTGPKPHHANMAAIFGLPATKAAAEQNPGMYRAAKVFAYAVAYGAGEDTVYEKVREELPDMLWADFLVAFNNYKNTYPVLFAFQREVVRQGTRLGYIDSGVLGRRMFFFERAWGESSPEATMMQNAPYQSTGADVVGAANRRVTERLVTPWRASKLKAGEVIEQLAQVHDELVFEVPERLAAEFTAECKRISEERPRKPDGTVLDWNLPVDIHWARRWKPVQARCGHMDAGERCRELVDVEVKELKTKDVWTGKCSHGHEKKIEVQKPKAA